MYVDKDGNKAMTDAELYNLTDDVSNLSKVHAVSYREEVDKSLNKAKIGGLATVVTTIFGGLYTLFQLGRAVYGSGAADTYAKYTNLAENADDYQKKWRDMKPEIRGKVTEFKE